jgi:hypothetical protein
MDLQSQLQGWCTNKTEHLKHVLSAGHLPVNMDNVAIVHLTRSHGLDRLLCAHAQSQDIDVENGFPVFSRTICDENHQ